MSSTGRTIGSDRSSTRVRAPPGGGSSIAFGAEETTASPAAPATSSFDSNAARDFVGKKWEESIEKTLVEYISIPNQSPDYDAEWATNGHLDRVIELYDKWIKDQKIAGLDYRIIREGERTPILYMDIPATGGAKGTILLYGHLDKQPPFEGWADGLGPYKPVIRDGKLYGRGGADDGYSMFGAVTAIKALHEQGTPLSRCVVMIESREESEGDDLEFYLRKMQGEIGNPDLVVCLDSGCGNYEQMWLTTSLRGIIMGELHVQIGNEGHHSGDASGIMPSTFRIARSLLSRIEDENTGEIKLDALHCDIPDHRRAEAHAMAEILGVKVFDHFSWVGEAKPVHATPAECTLYRTWKPTLCVTGQAGMPPTSSAGNVLRPFTTLSLSLRVPPLVNKDAALAALKAELERDPPYNATVSFRGDADPGWNSPALAPWLKETVDAASMAAWGKPCLMMGEGGSIPFMGLLGELFPQAQFVITGILGPESNAHGPNEFLHIDYTKRLITALSVVLARASQHIA